MKSQAEILREFLDSIAIKPISHSEPGPAPHGVVSWTVRRRIDGSILGTVNAPQWFLAVALAVVQFKLERHELDVVQS